MNRWQMKDIILGKADILEGFDKFYYLRDMIGDNGGANDASRTKFLGQ